MPSFTLHNTYTYEDMALGYFDCRKHKRMTGSALAFELNFEYGLHKLLHEINNGNYEIGPTRAFVVKWPKPREIWAALFRDRIIHHLICRDIAPYYEGKFIEDSYSCIKNRGSLAAIQRCDKFARRITQNWSKNAWILQMDIKNFFISIDKHILYDIITNDIGNSSLTSDLIKQVIFSDPTKNTIITNKEDFKLIKPEKSLWNCSSNNGLPIGNLTSQTFANVYLDLLDKFVKHKLKARYYVRYVDDFFIMSKDREQLYTYCTLINGFLKTNLKLELNLSKTRVIPINSGITFLGSHILPYRTLPKKMLMERINDTVSVLQNNIIDEHAFSSINSYLGLLRHKNTFKLRKKYCELLSIPTLLGYDSNYTKIIRIN